MPLSPPRWFQFTLTTWFVLVAIGAVCMVGGFGLDECDSILTYRELSSNQPTHMFRFWPLPEVLFVSGGVLIVAVAVIAMLILALPVISTLRGTTKSPRHWFQFRLSTWFVLVAILAWALATRPYWLTVSWEGPDYSIVSPLPEHILVQHEIGFPNPALLGPAVALAAFVGWKAASMIGRRVNKVKMVQMRARLSRVLSWLTMLALVGLSAFVGVPLAVLGCFGLAGQMSDIDRRSNVSTGLMSLGFATIVFVATGLWLNYLRRRLLSK